MGPQLDSCGRHHEARRAFDAALASMGPQLDSCGRVEQFGVVLGAVEASMGPQLDSCGRRGPIRRTRPGSPLLQWGRNLTVAEGSSTLPP